MEGKNQPAAKKIWIMIGGFGRELCATLRTIDLGKIMNSKSPKKYKSFLYYSWVILIVGFISLAYGLIKYFFLTPNIGVNFKTQLLVPMDGSISLIIGILFFPIGLYRILNRTKVFKQFQEIEEIYEKKNKH